MIWCILASVVALALVCIEHVRLMVSTRRRACWLVTILRAVAFLTLALFILPPRRIVQQPQADKLKIAVALDGSASTDVRTDGGTRRKSVEKMLADTAVRDFFKKSGRTEWRCFSDRVTAFEPFGTGTARIPALTGNTRLGDALAAMLKMSDEGTPLSAVVVFSDGRNNDGANPLEVAKQLKAKGIPVSTVGVSEASDAMDVGIRVENRMVKAVKYAPFDVVAAVTLTGREELRNLPVQLISNGVVIDSTAVDVTRGKPAAARFSTSLPLAGFHSLGVRIQPPKEDCRKDNDMDFLAVDVTETAKFNVLYLSYGIDWEWRFLNINCERNSQLDAAAVIQTGKNTFARVGRAPAAKKGQEGFPESSDAYEPYDVIIANGELFQHLNESQINAIVAFVENKGGGLVVRGSAENAPEKIHGLLPSRKTAKMKVTRPVKLYARDDLVFKRDTAKILQNQQGIWCMPPAIMEVVETPRNSMRTIMTAAEDDGPTVMAVHAYGAGRVAFLGIADTWRWAMAEKPASDIYAAFWNHLLSWMAETGRPMLRIAENGSQMTVGEPCTLTVDVLGEDFRPAVDDAVSCEITMPDGSHSTVQMLPSLDEMGQYTADIVPELPGECGLAVTAKGKSRTLTRKGVFLATMNSREMDDMTSDNALLQDIARLTGGQFMTHEDISERIADIPLSSKVPMAKTASPVFPRWLLFCVFAVAASLCWWSRRRLGLK